MSIYLCDSTLVAADLQALKTAQTFEEQMANEILRSKPTYEPEPKVKAGTPGKKKTKPIKPRWNYQSPGRPMETLPERFK
jgi:hypothetical protein